MKCSLLHHFLAALLACSPVLASAGENLDRVLSVMEEKVNVECDYRRLMKQLQKTRDPAQQRELGEQLTEVGNRMENIRKRVHAVSPNVEAMSTQEQSKASAQMAALVDRCNATLPPDARMTR